MVQDVSGEDDVKALAGELGCEVEGLNVAHDQTVQMLARDLGHSRIQLDAGHGAAAIAQNAGHAARGWAKF